MQFNTSTFLFAFLPVALALYYIVPMARAKNYVLLALSLLFYAWGDPGNVLLLVAMVLLNYLLGLLQAKLKSLRGNAFRKIVLTCTILLNVGLLAVCKYTGFVADNITTLIGVDFEVPSVALPLGVSYFTLKLVTYAVDVYRGAAPVQQNPFHLALYAAMFPAITAGPIASYHSISDQLQKRSHSLSKFTSGIRLFCIGMAKKVLLSNTVAILASSMLSYGGSKIGALGAWTGLAAYSFQLYFDFSGYSDMAIGLAKMFGFDFEKNFNYPYISRSVTEFWRRWHISLSTFFREYIYIPMGGSRVNTPRFILNMATVWVLTGVWHGAAWNFIWWGLYYLAVLLVEKFVLSRSLDRLPSLFKHCYVVVVFMLGWCLFWISDTAQLGEYLQALFGVYGVMGSLTYWQLEGWAYYPVLVACIVASTPIVPLIKANIVRVVLGKRLSVHPDSIGIKDVSTVELGMPIVVSQGLGCKRMLLSALQLLSDVVLIGLFVISVLSTVSGSFSPVIYAAF